MKTGKLDKNGVEIKAGDKIRLTGVEHSGDYDVHFGEGTYDSGVYTYLGFYVTDEDGESDGYGFILTYDSEFLEVI